MISEALLFIKDLLNEHLCAQSGQTLGEAEDKVIFISGENLDPISFKLGAITCLLINIEEEKILRLADPYVQTRNDGAKVRVQPDIRMNLYVLFIARFKLYEEGLSYLSRILEYFQTNRVLDHTNTPSLSPRIHRLIMELTTLALAEQNDVWNALRTTYHPSILYKVRMLVLREDVAILSSDIDEAEIGLGS